MPEYYDSLETRDPQERERALMAALTVDEHEDLVGAEAAQCRRPHGVGAVADGRSRKVERRRESLNHLRRLGIAARRDLFLRDDVDRNRLLRFGPRRARSDGDLFLEAKIYALTVKR